MRKLTYNQRTVLRIIVALALLIAGYVLSKTVRGVSEYVWLAVFLPAYFLVGYDVLTEATRNIFHGKVFDEKFLMTIATVGAFVIGEYPEGVAVMLFYQVGEFFQTVALNRSRKSVADLMDIRPDYANLVVGETVEKVSPTEVNVGDIIVIKAGERVPLDCVVTEGESSVDSSMLTGESLPIEVAPGSQLLSGSININGLLKGKAEKEYGQSTASKILELVENATDNKSTSENFIAKFAKYYTPFVVIVALILGVIPPIFLGNWSGWVYRAMIFLVVSCPCALVISVPLSFFGGIGNASKRGILVKGSNYLEALSKVKTVVFDKTGTLTKGVFAVNNVVCEGVNMDEWKFLVAHAENNSTHPIAKSLVKWCDIEIDSANIESVTELAGFGVSAVIKGAKVLAGKRKLMTDNGLTVPELTGSVIYVAVDGVYCGYAEIGDRIKDDAKQAVEDLTRLGVEKIALLTGDNRNIGNSVAEEVGIKEAYCELLPADKVMKVEELLTKLPKEGTLAFVGDGINDAPVLARADIGIAMGGVGSDSAIEAADIVLMTDEPKKIAEAVIVARKTLRIVKQNIVFSLVIKLLVLILGAIGWATMWEAVFADVGVAVIAILNAVRALGKKSK